MAHQSLYRIHRPATFAEVVGQEQVTKPLEEAAKSKKIGHAYLFAGSRGLGKTSVARIFASAIGCSENDLYEVDAASNNSVEDIRALTEGVYTLPFESPYKVYILDEAHMLSKSAWNAFLKTLEEPPARAVLARMVTAVAKKEGYTLAPDATELIAMLGDGSYRDALSVLQKVFAAASSTSTSLGAGKKLTREEVEQATGAPKREQVHALINALAAGERGKALEAIERAGKADVDMKLFLELVLETLRATLLIRYAPELRASLANEFGADEFAALEKFAQENPSTKLGAGGITHATMLAFLTAAERIRDAPIPALPLELAVLELFPE